MLVARRRHGRHRHRASRATCASASPAHPDRRRRPRGLDLLQRRDAPLPRRGRRRGLLARRRSTAPRSTAGSPCRDRDSFHAARRLAREEGILIGGSCGIALHAALIVARELDPSKTVLVILPDGGRPYLSKFYDDDWMDRARHARPARAPVPTVAQVLRAKVTEEPGIPSMVAIASGQPRGRRDRACCSATASRSCRWCGEDGDGQPALADILGSIHERQLLDRARARGRRSAAADRRRRRWRRRSPDRRPTRRVDDVYRDLQAQPAVVVADGDRAGRRAHARRPARVPGAPELTPALREVSLAAARREIVAAQGFRTRRRTAALRDVIAVVERLGCVQIDADLDRRPRPAADARGARRQAARARARPPAAPAGACSSTGRTRPR